MTTTYTVTDCNGKVIGRGLSARDAMIKIITYDGYDFEILWDTSECRWYLWFERSRQAAQQRGPARWRTEFSSQEAKEEYAANEIAVAALAFDFGAVFPQAMTDQAYDQMLAEDDQE